MLKWQGFALSAAFAVTACSGSTPDQPDKVAASERYIPTPNVREMLENDPERASLRTVIINACAKQMRATVTGAGETVSDTMVANVCECGADAAMTGKSNEQLQAGDVNSTEGVCSKWIATS